MRKTVVVAAMIASAIALPTATTAQPGPDALLYNLGEDLSAAWNFDETAKVWRLSGAAFDLGKANCEKMLAELIKQGVPSSTKLKIPRATPDLSAGEKTLDDARPACARIVRAGLVRDWEKWGIWAMQDAPKIGTGAAGGGYFQNCINAYETMLKKGVSKDTQVIPQQVGDQKWEGTVEELRKKWCDAGLKAQKAEQDKKDAPYKKAMKGEKLQMALTYRAVWLAGGQVTDDPATMAKATVWYIDTEPPTVCKNGAQAHVLKRFEFAGDKLAKTADINTCGVPRAKDFK